METYLKAGIWGVILTCGLDLFISGVGLIPPFLPAFIAVIAIIAVFKIDGIKEGLLIALMSYFFSEAILRVFAYGLLYLEYGMEPVQVPIQLSIVSLINLLLTPITATVAAYLGTYLVKIRSV